MAQRARRWWTSWARENGRGRETAGRGSERGRRARPVALVRLVRIRCRRGKPVRAPLAARRSVIRVGRDILFAFERAGERLFDVHLPHGEGGRVGDGTAG